MAILKFEVTDQHLKLLKHLRWSVNKTGFIIGTEDEEIDRAPFNENSLYEAIDLILNGKKNESKELAALTSHFLPFYSDEQKAEWDKLYAELPMALSVILQRQSFELGKFKTKWYDLNWEKAK